MAPHRQLAPHPLRPARAALTLLTVLALGVPAVATQASAGSPAPPGREPAGRTSATAADVPVYRDPPGYEGWKKAPRTREVKGPRVRLSTTGTHPEVTVDAAGTGHIVWNEGRGDEADATMYCRLERAASSCDVTRTLLWAKSYGPGDGPQFNTDDLGPRIVQVGEQLLVLSHRYPTMGDKPDGASSSTTVGWVSNDGGTTWSDAAILGKRNLGQLSVVGPDDDPLIANLAYDPFCGGTCVTAFRSGTYDPSEAVLNPDPNANYHATLVTDGQTLVAAMGDAGNGLWMRRWTGTEPVTQAANWTTTARIGGSEPELAAGPAGVFLLHRRLDDLEIPAALEVRPVDGQVPSPGAGTVISGRSVAEGQLVQDARGRLHAVWVEAGSGVRMRSGEAAGLSFGPATTVMGGDTNGQLGISTAADGGGFVVLNHTGGVTAPGEVVAAGVGSLAPTGETGLGDLPGGGNITCQQVDFGDFEVETVEGCFLKGTGENRHVVVTRGAVTLNGLEIVPLPGDQLVIDAEELTIDTIGQARVLLRDGDAEIELFRGRVHRNLADVSPGTPLFEFPQAEYQADVLGFPVASGLLVQLTAEGVRIPVELTLPTALGGFTAQAVLLGRTGEGLVLDSLKVQMGPIPLGVMMLDEVRLDWKTGGTWTGGGKLTMPVGGSIEASIGFVGGDFDFATFDYYPVPVVTLAPFVYLTRVGGGLDVQPDIVITAGGDVGMGAPVRELTPVQATGEFTMTFPRSGPASFRLDGQVELFAIRIGAGYVELRTDGYGQFHGDTTLSLGPLSGGVRVDGFVDATGGQFGADLSAGVEYCTWVKDPAGVQPDRQVCSTAGGVDAVVSSIGFAACAEVDPDPLPSFSIGLAQRWDEIEPALLVNPYLATAEILSAVASPCETGPYRVPAPARAATARRAAAAGGTGFAVPDGLPTATFLVPGEGGVPDIEVTGPDGTTLVGPGATGAGVRLLSLDAADAVWVVVDDPPPGDYVVVPRAGSVPLGDVVVSEGFAVATVRGDVSRGRVEYQAKHLTGGQRITFVERGEFGTNIIATRSDPKGTLRFRPAAGPGGRRVVEAQVVSDGLPKRTVTLGAFRVADPSPPGPVRKLHARHRRSVVTVTYRAPAKAARVEVRVTGSAGSSVMRSVGAGKRKVVLKGFRWDKRITVTVRTRGDDGLLGPKRVVRIG